MLGDRNSGRPAHSGMNEPYSFFFLYSVRFAPTPEASDQSRSRKHLETLWHLLQCGRSHYSTVFRMGKSAPHHEDDRGKQSGRLFRSRSLVTSCSPLPSENDSLLTLRGVCQALLTAK